MLLSNQIYALNSILRNDHFDVIKSMYGVRNGLEEEEIVAVDDVLLPKEAAS